MTKFSKVINVRFDESQAAAIELAAAQMGVGVSTFLRVLAVREARDMGINISQPQAD